MSDKKPITDEEYETLLEVRNVLTDVVTAEVTKVELSDMYNKTIDMFFDKILPRWYEPIIEVLKYADQALYKKIWNGLFDLSYEYKKPDNRYKVESVVLIVSFINDLESLLEKEISEPPRKIVIERTE